MPVSHEHLKTTCQVWDGLTYETMDVKEAAKLEKQGLVQRTKNLQAKDLKTAAQFNETREATAMLPGMDDSPKKKRKTYKTRQMKAET